MPRGFNFFRRRWCVIAGQKLLYFKSQKDSKARGEIGLVGAVVTLNADGLTEHKFSWGIKPKDAEYVLHWSAYF